MTRTNLSLLAASVLVATGLFWAKILVSPPVTMAAPPLGMDIDKAQRTAPKDLRSFDDVYQRHIGVLDVLNGVP